MHPSIPRDSLLISRRAMVRTRGEDLATQSRYLVRSAEPAVVFSSLALLCVPSFSDACTIDIVEAGELSYRIAQHRRDLDPAHASGPRISDRAVRTSFASTGSDDPDAGYAGVMTHSWRFRHPTGADMTRAAALARNCVAIVAEERRLAGPPDTRDAVERARTAREHLAMPPLLQLDCRSTSSSANR